MIDKHTLHQIQYRLRSKKYMTATVIDRVEQLRKLGYTVDRVRHHGSRVGDLHTLKCGEARIAIDAPRGKYRTAWAIIVSAFGKLENML